MVKPRFKLGRWNLGLVPADLPRRSKLWGKFFNQARKPEGALAALERSRVA
jgi:hypothetical protein